MAHRTSVIRRAYDKEYASKLKELRPDLFEAYRQCALNKEKIRKKQQRQALLTEFGGKCRRCGFDDARALQIDHVSGGGHAERKLIGSNSDKFYKLVKENPSRYQLLCANCNWIKRYENSEIKGRKKKVWTKVTQEQLATWEEYKSNKKRVAEQGKWDDPDYREKMTKALIQRNKSRATK